MSLPDMRCVSIKPAANGLRRILLAAPWLSLCVASSVVIVGAQATNWAQEPPGTAEPPTTFPIAPGIRTSGPDPKGTNTQGNGAEGNGTEGTGTPRFPGNPGTPASPPAKSDRAGSVPPTKNKSNRDAPAKELARDTRGMPAKDTAGFRNRMAEPTPEKLREQIKNLSSPSFRTRQLAVWYLEQYPKLALPLLREASSTSDLNIGSEVVSMLSTQAMMPDPDISISAHEALKEMAGGDRSVTAISHLAISALDNIAERQDLLARQALQDVGVDLGPLRLTIGGTVQNEMGFSSSFIVHVNENFRGTDADMRLFRFLRAFETVYLEGPSVSSTMMREVMAMPDLKRVVLAGPAIRNDLLLALFDADEIQHLELLYTEIDDEAIATIVDLPLSGSLRIYGSKISLAGAQRIRSSLKGLDIYVGRGGFLGVKTSQNNLQVASVVPGGGADRGGIQARDTITHVNDKTVNTMPQLREELANFAPGEMVEITVLRPVFGSPKRDELKLPITLGKQETPPN